MRRVGKDGLRVVGLGIAACAACCAAPVLGFLAATGVSTLAALTAFGAAGLVLLVPAAAWLVQRRSRVRTCEVEAPVPVELGRKP